MRDSGSLVIVYKFQSGPRYGHESHDLWAYGEDIDAADAAVVCFLTAAGPFRTLVKAADAVLVESCRVVQFELHRRVRVAPRAGKDRIIVKDSIAVQGPRIDRRAWTRRD